MSERYDLVVVGTGFASSFFLRKWRSRRAGRVLVLEAGKRHAHDWLKGHRDALLKQSAASFENRSPQKPWRFTRAFGGSSNCWWACTPRMLPADFELQSRYGVGTDWPVGYAELERYYLEAERAMSVAGAGGPAPRSAPYPQPAHRMSTVDEALARLHPGAFFPLPTARPSQPTTNRPACCNNGVCNLCPIDSKFTISNGLGGLYDGVELRTGAVVQAVEFTGGSASGVVWLEDGVEHSVQADAVALGANAIFNAHILLRSGLDHPRLGRGLMEQAGVQFDVDLAGMDNLPGSTSLTGHGYMLYDGPHRREHAAGLMETSSLPYLRSERGKWRQRLVAKLIFEEHPRLDNTITLGSDPTRPVVEFKGWTPYNRRAVQAGIEGIEGLLRGLPVEKITHKHVETEKHVMGGTPMGTDPTTSIVDRRLRHHTARNLWVLGAGVFPTAAPANPTLTLSALSLWAADV